MPQLLKKLSVLLLTVPMAVLSRPSQNEENVNFTSSISDDASPEVLARTLMADEKPTSTITFEKSTYHFYPDRVYEMYSNIYNHDDVVVDSAFPSQRFKQLTVDGQGTTFVFHGRMVPFLIKNPENITIKNVAIDWNVTFHSEGTIIANDPDNQTFDCQFTDEYPIKSETGNLYSSNPITKIGWGKPFLFDPKRKAIMFDTEAYTNITTVSKTAVQHNVDNIEHKYKIDPLSKLLKSWGVENTFTAEKLQPGIVRIHGHSKKLPPV